MTQRRKFSKQFKCGAVDLTRQPGAVVSQIAHDIGIGANLLWRWRRELDANQNEAFTGTGNAGIGPRFKDVAG